VQRHAFRQAVVGDVERGDLERGGREVGRLDARLGEALREEDGEAARARADVRHVGDLRGGRQPLRDGLGDELDEVGTRDDDAFVDAEAQAAEPGLADEVAGGDAVEDAAFDEAEEGGLLLRGQRPPEAGGERFPGQAGGVAEERQRFLLRVDEALAVRDAAGLEEPVREA